MLEIRKATEADIAAVCDIAIVAWTPIREVFRRDIGDGAYHAFFDGWQENKCCSVSDAMRTGRGYVSVLDGRVVGFISYRVDLERHTAHIGENAVDPDCRGHGIGVKQYEFIFERMKEEGIEYVCVMTGGDDGHAPARRAYQKAGFEKYLDHVTYYKKLD